MGFKSSWKSDYFQAPCSETPIFLLFVSGHEAQVGSFRPLKTSKNFNLFKYLWTLIDFVTFFFRELFMAGISVFRAILNPSRLKPGVIAVPLDIKSDAEITLLANLITLTPGTLTLDVSTDKRVIYIHTIGFKDVESFRKEIKGGFEKRVIEVMNP